VCSNYGTAKLFSDPPRFSYPADHFLTSELEEHMIGLLREYIRDGELLSVHHPDEPDAHDDAPDSTALALLAAKEGFVGGNVIYELNHTEIAKSQFDQNTLLES
jgi:hypothetical protein